MLKFLQKFRGRSAFVVSLTVAALLTGCGGGGGGGTALDSGTLRLGLTDSPSCGYDAVNVTVQKVRVHQSSTAADTAAGHATATITGVPVTTTAGAAINPSSAPISTPASGQATASGPVTITPVPSVIDATVVARQTYSGGTPVAEVAGGPVDGVAGTFSLTLPTGAPVKTVYVAGASSISFATDPTATAGKYTLVATSGGVSKSSPIDVSGGNVTDVSFAFP